MGPGQPRDPRVGVPVGQTVVTNERDSFRESIPRAVVSDGRSAKRLADGCRIEQCGIEELVGLSRDELGE